MKWYTTFRQSSTASKISFVSNLRFKGVPSVLVPSILQKVSTCLKSRRYLISDSNSTCRNFDSSKSCFFFPFHRWEQSFFQFSIFLHIQSPSYKPITNFPSTNNFCTRENCSNQLKVDDAVLTLVKILAKFGAQTKRSINVGYDTDIYKDMLRNVLCCQFRFKH